MKTTLLIFSFLFVGNAFADYECARIVFKGQTEEIFTKTVLTLKTIDSKTEVLLKAYDTRGSRVYDYEGALEEWSSNSYTTEGRLVQNQKASTLISEIPSKEVYINLDLKELSAEITYNPNSNRSSEKLTCIEK